MKRPSDDIRAAVATALSAALLGAALSGSLMACGDDGATGSGGSAVRDGSPAAAATLPAPQATDTAVEPGSVGIASADDGYDAALGGLFQVVAVEVADDGTVTLAWVASPEAAGAKPAARVEKVPGGLEVWLSDTRPHGDVTAPITTGSSPITKLSWRFPPDDALVVVRLALAESAAGSSAAVESGTGDAGGGLLLVRLDG